MVEFEAKFGKRKYHRGHRVDGFRVLGGVERTSERRAFLVEVKDCEAETLKAVIEQHDIAGSIIHADCFKSYSQTGEIYKHLTVNHSQNFKDPKTDCHANTVESTWAGLKLRIQPKSRISGSIDDHLGKFIWRKRNAKNKWKSLVECLKKVSHQ